MARWGRPNPFLNYGMIMTLSLQEIPKSDEDLYFMRLKHYSESNGFIGRTIIYKILWNDVIYGAIVAGSATKHLPGRDKILLGIGLNNIINNTFFHIEKIDCKYPCRNFALEILQTFRYIASRRWYEKYGDIICGFESLVELPRTGEIYKRDKWTEVGLTQGKVCRRRPNSLWGQSTDSWGGVRVWSKTELKPKRVFARTVD